MKITLLGDSIRMQYQNAVGEMLGSDFEIFAPAENCRFSKYTLRGLFDWRNNMSGSRIVHWNNGLWDICDILGDGKIFCTDEEYLDNMLRIADVLLARYEKVIFATTTPVTERNLYNKNSDIERFNALLVPKLKEKGIIINDLYSLIAQNIDKYVSNDNIHLTDEGIVLCAQAVTQTILEAAKDLPETKVVDTDEQKKQDNGAPVLI